MSTTGISDVLSAKRDQDSVDMLSLPSLQTDLALKIKRHFESNQRLS